MPEIRPAVRGFVSLAHEGPMPAHHGFARMLHCPALPDKIKEGFERDILPQLEHGAAGVDGNEA